MIAAAGVGLRDGQRGPRAAAPGAARFFPTNDDDGVAVAVERHVLGKEKGVSELTPSGRG